jgi:carboxypeptidase family protein
MLAMTKAGRAARWALLGVALAATAACSRPGDEPGTPAGPSERATASGEPRARAPGEAATSPAGDAATQAAAARPHHTLTGTVRTYDGRALPGAVVRAEPVAVFPHAPDPRTPSETTADAAGAFALPSLEAGDWALSVSAEGAIGTYAATVRVPERERFDVVLPRGSAVEGTVIDETTRAPVGGARVRLSGHRTWIGEARTSADGRFAMAVYDDPSGDRWRIDAAGYATAPAESSRGEFDARVLGRHEVTLVAQRGQTLTGRVVGDGGPIAGARVTLQPGGGPDDPSDVRAATTDADGRYQVEHLVDGRLQLGFWICAEAAGWVQKDEPDPDVAGPSPPTGDPVDVAKDGWTAPDIEMRRRLPIGRCTIAGVVVDEDEHPVAGVPLVTQHRVGAVRATSEADGSFVLADVPTEAEKGSVEVLCARGCDWEGSQSVHTQTGAAVRDVRVYVSPIARPQVRGRVLAPDRTPVEGARVVVVPFRVEAHCTWGPDEPRPGVVVRTAAGGTFDVAFAPEDHVAVVVDAPGFVRWTADFETSDLPESIDVELAALVAQSGRVVRAGTDIGVGGLDVALVSGVKGDHRDDAERLARFGSRVVGTTAADGSFRIEDVAARASLRISGAGWVAAEVSLNDAAADGLRVEIRPALELSGRAQFADGNPCRGVELALYEVDPDASDSTRVEWKDGDPPGDRPFRAAEDGTFRCDGLVAGRYWLEFKAGAPHVIRRVVGPLEAGTRDVRVELVRGATIRGRVLLPDGSPAKRVKVTASPDERDGPDGEAATDSAGAFAVGGLDGGAYAIGVAEDGYLAWTRAGVRASGDPVEVRLDAGLAVSGVLTDASGEAIHVARLVVEPVDAAPPAATRRVETDYDGRFRVTGLTKGRWRLRIDGDPPPVVLPETVVEAGSESLELRTLPKPPEPAAEEPRTDGR